MDTKSKPSPNFNSDNFLYTFRKESNQPVIKNSTKPTKGQHIETVYIILQDTNDRNDDSFQNKKHDKTPNDIGKPEMEIQERSDNCHLMKENNLNGTNWKSILPNCDINEIISKFLLKSLSDPGIFKEVKKYIQSNLLLSAREKSLSLNISSQERDEKHMVMLLKCMAQLKFYELASALSASSLEKIKAIGQQLYRCATSRLKERPEVMTQYPSEKFLCKANENNIIKMESLPGFELKIPVECLARDTEITITVYFADPPYNYGIQNIKATLLSPIIRIEPDRLELIKNSQYPTLQLPFFHGMESKPSSLIDDEEKNLIQLFSGKNLYAKWSTDDDIGNPLKRTEKACVFQIDHFAYFCAGINHSERPSKNFSAKSPQFLSLRLQQQIDFRVFLSVTGKGSAFIEIVITQKGIPYEPKRYKSVEQHELFNDLEDVTCLKNGYYQIKFLSSYLIHNSVDSKDSIKDIYINWNARNIYSVTYRCQLSDDEPAELCQIIIQCEGKNGKPTEVISSSIFLPNDVNEENLRESFVEGMNTQILQG
ncbi:hypothetical protein TrispH2_011038 [Trichoplax sp. H2]|nr:hypothetical protein TrispH2_011038 [Trichoplax sp. H2]|eukprot:RDD37833.1 hypothetical protein TrispH2_011038 [Trichoplax sp. H2]